MRTGLTVLLVAGLGAVGWFVGHQWWHNATAGVMAGSGVGLLGWGAATDRDIASVAARSILALALTAAGIYALLLVVEAPLPAFGLRCAPYSLFVRPLAGAAAGAGE